MNGNYIAEFEHALKQKHASLVAKSSPDRNPPSWHELLKGFLGALTDLHPSVTREQIIEKCIEYLNL